MGNIYKVISWGTAKKKIPVKIRIFFRNEHMIAFIQNQFYNCTDNEDNRSFFSELKQIYKKERYLNLTKPRLSSNKLAVVIGKWYIIKKENRFGNLNAIEDEFDFLTDCQNYKKLRESIQDTEHIDLSREHIPKKLKKLFSNGSLRSLYVLGKFIQTTMGSRENSQT